jgi:hypothetical protein
VAALARAVGIHAALQHRWAQPAGHQHGGRGDETVYQDHAAFGRGLQHRPDHGGHFQPAHGGQHGQRLGHPGVQIQHGAQHFHLAAHAFGIQAGAHAADAGHIDVGQPRQQQRCAGGVADAHFAQQQRIAREFLDQRHAVLDGQAAFGIGHGGTDRAVLRAIGHLAAPQARLAGLGQLVFRVCSRRAMSRATPQSTMFKWMPLVRESTLTAAPRPESSPPSAR